MDPTPPDPTSRPRQQLEATTKITHIDTGRRNNNAASARR
jgi:hypothetical protein